MKFLQQMKNIVSPLDSWALRLHSPVSSLLLLTTFGLVFSEYFGEMDVKCFNPQNKLKVLEDAVKEDICTTYITMDVFEPDDGFAQGEREKLLYRWVPFLMVLLAFIVHLPQLLRSRLESPKLTRAMGTLLSAKFDELPDHLTTYVYDNLGGHGGQMVSSVIISFFCLVSDVVSIFLIDLAIGNKFITLYQYYPFTRHLVTALQSDFNRMFPVAAKCVLSPVMGMTGLNTEVYGCTFPMNVFYEKFFILLFVWYSCLLLLSSVSLLTKIFDVVPFCNRRRLFSNNLVSKEIEDTLLRKLSNNEIWVLGKLRKCVTISLFAEYLRQAYDVLQQVEETHVDAVSHDVESAGAAQDTGEDCSLIEVCVV